MTLVCLLITGHGIFATKVFRDGEFVLDYAGELLSDWREGDKKMDQTYMYYFTCGHQKYW